MKEGRAYEGTCEEGKGKQAKKRGRESVRGWKGVKRKKGIFKRRKYVMIGKENGNKKGNEDKQS